MEENRSHVDLVILEIEKTRRFESRVLPVTRSIGELSDQRSFRATRYSVFGDRSVEGLSTAPPLDPSGSMAGETSSGKVRVLSPHLVKSPDGGIHGACSSARLERPPDKREVDGSSPSRPTSISCDPQRLTTSYREAKRTEPLEFRYTWPYLSDSTCEWSDSRPLSRGFPGLWIRVIRERGCSSAGRARALQA